MDPLKPTRSVFKQFTLALMANFTALAPAMSLGFSAIAVPILTGSDNEHPFSSEQASWFASIASIATPLGCLFSGPFADQYGRRMALFLNNVVGLTGWIAIAAGFYFVEHQYGILLCGRILTGLSTGLASMTASVYMAEVSTTELRGVFTTWGGLFVSLGVLIVYCIGAILKDNWGMAAVIIACFPCMGIFMTSFFIPESPTWLVSKNRIDDAKRSMCKIFSTKDFNVTVQAEIEELLTHNRGSKVALEHDNKTCCTQLRNRFSFLTSPTCYKPFLLMVTFFFFQQFSGTFVIVFYAMDIVKEAGVNFDKYLAIIMIALTRFVAAILVSYLSKLFGRRPNSIISGAGMTICMTTLAVYMYTETSIAWLPIALLVTYFFASTIGFLTMPFAMTAELFPLKVRGTVTGLVTAIGYFFNFLMVKSYPMMKERTGSVGVFTFYGAVSLAGTVFVVMFLPETRGKTLQEIEDQFRPKHERCCAKEEGAV